MFKPIFFKSKKLCELLTISGLALTVPYATALEASSEEPPAASFTVKKVVVYGVNLLTEDEVAKAVGGLVGKEQKISDLDEARLRLKEAYKQKGYDVISVTVPPQKIQPDGPLMLQVVEPKLGKISVRGNKHFNDHNLIEVVGGLQEGEVPNSREIAKRIRLSNDHPSKKTQMVYRAGSEPQTVDAEYVVNDIPVNRFGLVLDNTGSKSSGRLRLSLAGQFNNLFNQDHQLGFQYQTDLEKQSSIEVASLSYKIPLYALGSAVEAFYVDSSADVSLIAGAAGVPSLSVVGNGRAYGARYIHLLERLDEFDQRVILSYSNNEFSNQIALQQIQGAASLQKSNPLGVSYAIRGTKGANSVAANAGLFHATSVENIDGTTGLSTLAGSFDSSFTALRAGVQYQYTYKQARPGIFLQTQLSNDRMLNSDQFGAGGVNSVRGFDERVLAGDQGVSVSLRMPFVNLEQHIGLEAIQVSAGPFYDYALVKDNERPNRIKQSTTISSAGVSIDLNHRHGSLSLSYAQVVDGAALQEKGEQRLHANLTLSY